MKATRANIRSMKTLEQVVEHLASVQEQLDRIEEAIVALSGKGSSPALDAIVDASRVVGIDIVADDPDDAAQPKGRKHGTGG